jgi:hypothetical protein
MTAFRSRLHRQVKKILCSVFISVALVQGYGQNSNLTIQFNHILFNDLADTIERLVPVKIYYSDKWVDSLYLSVNSKDTPFDELLEKVFSKEGLNFIITDNNKVILSKGFKIKTTFQKEYLEYLNNNYLKTDTAKYALPEPEQESKAISDEYRIFKIGKPSADNSEQNAILSGTVFDLSEGEPLPGAVVYVEELKAGAITNNAGFYSITLPVGQYQIEYRTMGMKSTRRNVIIFSNGSLDLGMVKNIKQLNEVFIYDNRENNVKNVRIGIERINGKMLKQIPMGLGEVDIIKSSLLLPGVQSAGEASSGFNVRGGTTAQNLVLLDHAPIINTSHFFGFFSAINSDLIADATLYKSSIPAKYGGRISSVMEIVPQTGSAEKVKVNGGISPVTGRLLIEGPILKNKITFIVGARTTYSEWLLGLLKDKQLQNSGAGFYDIQGLMNYNIDDKNSISLSGYFSSDRFNYYHESNINYGNFASTFKWKHTFNQKLSLQSYAIISDYNYTLDNNTDSTKFSSVRYELNQKIMRLDFLYLPGNKHKLEFGVDAIYYSLLPGVQEPFGDYSLIVSKRLEREKALEPSVYLSDDFEVTPNFSISGGIRGTLFTSFGPKTEFRYNENTPRSIESIIDTIKYRSGQIIKSYPHLEFRLSSRFIISQNLSFKAGIQRVYQYLHMISNTTSMSPTDIWKLSDSYFRPQRGDQFSLGLYYNIGQRGIETSIEAYYKTFSNLIDYKGGALLLMNENLETDIINGIGKAYGTELMVNKKAGMITGWASYTYSRSLLKVNGKFESEKLNGGKYFPANFDKPHDFKLVINAKLARRINITSNFSYSTGRPITYPVAFYKFNNTARIYYSNRNQFRIPDYMRLDLSLTLNGNLKQRKLNHSSLTATIYNVLGRKNPYSIFFKNEGGEIKGYQMTIFPNPLFIITYNFRLFGNAKDDF